MTLKKIMTVFLTITFVLSSAVLVYAIDETFDAAIYDEEVKLMKTLGVSTEGIDGAQNTMYLTRAEYAVMVIQSMGIAVDGISGEHNFSDVADDYWAASYIASAAQMGFFNSAAGVEFEPDDRLSFEQAVTVAVRMLGCEVIAKNRGGYPSGYISLANEKGLLKGLSNIQIGNDITREQAYCLLYNTVHANLVISVGVGEKTSFVIQEDRNILTEYHKIYYVEGVISADYLCSIEGNTTMPEGRFRIGQYIFSDKNGLAEDMVGYNVRSYYYYDNDETVYDVIAVYADNNKVISIAAEDITYFDYASGYYTISDGDKDKKISIGNVYNLIYNYEYIDGSDAALMNPATGSVTLIDNNDDNIYETIKVEEYFNIVFSAFDQYTNTIIDNAGAPMINSFNRSLDLDDYEIVVADVDDFSKLQEGMIISVVKNRNNRVVKLICTEQSIFGVVTEIRENNAGDNVYIINNQELVLSNDLRFNSNLINIGDEYTLFLDGYGKIAYASLNVKQRGGYFARYKSDPKKLKNDMVSVFLGGGRMEKYSVADNVNIESFAGSERVNGMEFAAKCQQKMGTERFYALFELNSNGELSKLILPKIVTTQNEYDAMGDYPIYRVDYYVENWPASCHNFYKEVTQSFGNWLALSESTVVLSVPEETNNDFVNDDFSVSRFYEGNTIDVTSKNAAGSKIAGEVDVYKLNGESGLADIIVSYGRDSASRIYDDEGNIGVFESVLSVLNPSTGAVEEQITFIQGNVKKTAILENSTLLQRSSLENTKYPQQWTDDLTPVLSANKTQLELGDVFKYATNSSGQINQICLLYDYKNNTETYSALRDQNRVLRVIQADLTYNSNNYIEMEVPYKSSLFNPEPTTERTKIAWVPIVVVNTVTKTVNIGNNMDLQPDNRIIICSRYQDNKLVVVYK